MPVQPRLLRLAHVTNWESRPFYAELFDGPGFECGSLVEVMTQHTNSVVVAATRLRYRDLPKPGTLYDHVLVAVGWLAERGHDTVTPAQVAAQLELAGLTPKGNTVYRTLHRLSDPQRFEVPPLERAGRGKFCMAGSI